MIEQHNIEVGEPVSQGTMYSGAGVSAAVWYLELGDILALIATVVTIVGAGFSIYFGLRRERRQRELHKLQIEHLKGEDHD